MRPIYIALAIVALIGPLPDANEVQGDEPPGFTRSRGIAFHTKAAPLSYLIDHSKNAFLGKVLLVDRAKITIHGKSIATKAVTFRVEEVAKGDLKPGQEYRVTLSPLVNPPIKPGEELFWYLPAEGDYGFVTPLGIESGHFRVFTRDNVKYAINLKDNEGLWSSKPGGRLYNDPAFTEEGILGASRTLTHATAPVEMIASYANQPNKPRAIPLGLLISATKAKPSRFSELK